MGYYLILIFIGLLQWVYLLSGFIGGFIALIIAIVAVIHKKPPLQVVGLIALVIILPLLNISSLWQGRHSSSDASRAVALKANYDLYIPTVMPTDYQIHSIVATKDPKIGTVLVIE